ncbi:MAG: sugar phosphate isomerase/epimerase [Burkholderiales bacterium]|nr:sugar phosphate isomerase/epimerase [Burkholderiales bacterium]
MYKPEFKAEVARFARRLALHTWTLESTPFPEVLRVAREAGWNAVEIRRSDVLQAYKAGYTREKVIVMIGDAGIPVAVTGTEYGLLFAAGAERKRLLAVLDETCFIARAVGCDMIMTATGQAAGSLDTAVANMRAAADVVAGHGLRIAYEFSSAHQTMNTLDIAQELHARVAHPAFGLLLDTYHLERSGAGGRGFAGVPAEHIFAIQYSDVPVTAPQGMLRPTDRLTPGRGCVRWAEVFALLAEKSYQGYLSYEAPNPELWARPAVEAAREGVAATRALLGA